MGGPFYGNDDGACALHRMVAESIAEMGRRRHVGGYAPAFKRGDPTACQGAAGRMSARLHACTKRLDGTEASFRAIRKAAEDLHPAD
jgi:hypothetical protein